VLGDNPLLWWYPQQAIGTGLKYPVAEGTSKWVEFSREDPREDQRGDGMPPDGADQSGQLIEGRKSREMRSRRMGPGNAPDGMHVSESDGEVAEDMV
jgi:hypothetical protein